MRRIKVWDLPVRLFHWSIVVLIAAAWATQELNKMEWHMRIGYAILALLLFRIVWGFIGSDTARFVRFLKSPAAALRHLSHLRRREPDREIGHNAAGGWMVLLMLVLLGVQAGTGLFSNDDSDSDGPLMHLIGKDQSDLHQQDPFAELQPDPGGHRPARGGDRRLRGAEAAEPGAADADRNEGDARRRRRAPPGQPAMGSGDAGGGGRRGGYGW